MDPRARNRRVTIKAPPTEPDSLGQYTGDWTTVCTVMANIRFLRGLETIRGGAQTAIATASVNIAYRKGLTTAMRLEHDGTQYQITAVLPDEARRLHVELTVEAIQ